MPRHHFRRVTIDSTACEAFDDGAARYDLYLQTQRLPPCLQHFECIGLMVTARRLGRHERSIRWGLKAVRGWEPASNSEQA